MNAFKKLFVPLMLASISFWVVACGVKSAPTPPKGATYPMSYPAHMSSKKAPPKQKSKGDASILGNRFNDFFQYPNRRSKN